MTISKPIIGTGAALALLVGAAQLLRPTPAPAPLPGAAAFPAPPGPIAVLPICLAGWACVEEPSRIVCQCAGGAR